MALLEDDVGHLGDVLAATRQTLFVMDSQGRALTRIWWAGLGRAPGARSVLLTCCRPFVTA